MKKPELLIPAGHMESLKSAVIYGADAVYIGGKDFSLRSRANNFSLKEMAEALSFAHDRGVRVYVAVNVFAREGELSGIKDYLRELGLIRPDALIISDPGVVLMARELCPDIDIHISTQLNSTNHMDLKFWKKMGAKRVVFSRELSLKEIEKIRQAVDKEAIGIEMECFVHGAMCISYSGRCLLSAFLTGRSANGGACTHPCRWSYSMDKMPSYFVTELSRPGEPMAVEEDERGTYIFNSRDLCMIEHIPELIAAGIDSFKVEGRMKNTSYSAITAFAYRQAIDDYFNDPAVYRERIPHYMDMLSRTVHRGFTTGFYFGDPGADGQIYDKSGYEKNFLFLGMAEGIDKDGGVYITQKNKFSAGDTIEILSPSFGIKSSKVLGIKSRDSGEEMPCCPHAGERLKLRLEKSALPYDILLMEARHE